MTTPTLGELWGCVAASLDDAAVPIIGWIDGRVEPSLPPGWRPVRIVFALPTARVASLRHWRHEVEVWDERQQVHVVAVEASVVARAALVGEPTVRGWARGAPLHGVVEALERALDRWCSDAAATPFDAVDAWLAAARAAADHPVESSRPM